VPSAQISTRRVACELRQAFGRSAQASWVQVDRMGSPDGIDSTGGLQGVSRLIVEIEFLNVESGFLCSARMSRSWIEREKVHGSQRC